MNKIHILPALLAGALLTTSFSACQMLNKYQSPEIELTGLYRGEQSDDTTSIAFISWRSYFADTYLQTLIEEGLRQNFDLRIAYARIEQAEAALQTARYAYFPTVALTGQATHTRTSEKNGDSKTLGFANDQFRLGAAVQWEVDIWGKINRQGRARHAQYLNSLAYRNLIQTSLIANIATSYYSLVALDEQLRITNETVAVLEENVATMQALMDAGMLNGAAVEQSKALFFSARISIPEMESRIRQLENALSAMLGRKPDVVERQNIQTMNLPETLKHGVPAQLLARRPDVMQAELTFRAAFEMKNAAQAALYPSISLNAGSMIGYGANTLADFFRPANMLANVIGGLTQPIFAGNQLRGQVKIATAQQKEALLNFEKTTLAAGQEVSDILFTFEASTRKNDSREKQIQSLSAAVYFTHELLSAGEANYIEVLTAEQNLLQAKLGQVSDRLEQFQAVVNLYRALGGGVY